MLEVSFKITNIISATAYSESDIAPIQIADELYVYNYLETLKKYLFDLLMPNSIIARLISYVVNVTCVSKFDEKNNLILTREITFNFDKLVLGNVDDGVILQDSINRKILRVRSRIKRLLPKRYYFMVSSINYTHHDSGSFLSLKEIFDETSFAGSNAKLLMSIGINSEQINTMQDNYKCFLTDEIMDLPTRDKESPDDPPIEFLAYVRWIQNNGTNPFNRRKLPIHDLKIDYDLQHEIGQFVRCLFELESKCSAVDQLVKTRFHIMYERNEELKVINDMMDDECSFIFLKQ